MWSRTARARQLRAPPLRVQLRDPPLLANQLVCIRQPQ